MTAASSNHLVLVPSSGSSGSLLSRRSSQQTAKVLKIRSHRQQTTPFDFFKSLRSSSNDSSPSLKGRLVSHSTRKGQSQSTSPLLNSRKSLLAAHENADQEKRQLAIPNPRETRKFLKEVLKGELDFAEAYLRMYNFDSPTLLIAYHLASVQENFEALQRMRKLLGAKITPDMHYFSASSFLTKKDFDPSSQIFQQILDCLEERELALLLFEAVCLKNESLVKIIVEKFTLTEPSNTILENVLHKAAAEGLTSILSLLLIHPFSQAAIENCNKYSKKPEIQALLSQHRQVSSEPKGESKEPTPINLKSSSAAAPFRNLPKSASNPHLPVKKTAKKSAQLLLASPAEKDDFLQKVVNPSQSAAVETWLQTFEAGPIYLRFALYLTAKTGDQPKRTIVERLCHKKITLDMWYLVASTALHSDDSFDRSIFSSAIEKIVLSQDSYFLFLLLHQAISKRKIKEINILTNKIPKIEKLNNEELFHFFFEEILRKDDAELALCLVQHNLPLKEFYGQLLLKAKPPFIAILGPYASSDAADKLLKTTEDPAVINAALPFASKVAREAIMARQKSSTSPSSAKALSPKGTSLIQTVEEAEEISFHDDAGTDGQQEETKAQN